MENQVLDDEFVFNKTKPKVKWAGFWIRVLASFIDVVAYAPLIGLNIYNLNTIRSLPLQLLINLLTIAYKPYMEYHYGATLGKMAVGIKVVNKDFEQITLSQSLLRYIPLGIGQLISIVATILVFQHPDFPATSGWLEVGALQNEVVPASLNSISSLLLFASCIVVAFTDRKQGVHDMIANTYCIYKRS